MRTFAIDPITRALVIVAGRPQLVSGVAAVAQKLRVRFRFRRGSWFRDRTVGIPFDLILGVKNAEVFAESVLRRVVTTCPGVRSLDDFVFDSDAAQRDARVTFAATAVDGEPIEVTDFVVGG